MTEIHLNTMASKKLGVIGTGDFARAFTIRAQRANFDVVMGSRDPTHRHLESIDPSLSKTILLDIADCIAHSDIIINAIHPVNYTMLSRFRNELKEKILVDVSNSTRKDVYSNAEFLSTETGAKVVKAFNGVSSWALQSESFGASKNVYICSDYLEAKLAVMQLARDMGFVPVDRGNLSAAHDIENETGRLFPQWVGPTAFAWGLFFVYFLWTIARMFMRKTIIWSEYPLTRLNPAVCTTSVTLLACCYLPGEFAAFFQLYYGNKHTRFPNWLDRWMKSRKQLGLWAFFFATFHVIISICILTSWNLGHFYKIDYKMYTVNSNLTIPVPSEFRFSNIGEIMLLTGVLAYLVMAVLAVSTIPSISSQLNWMEYVFVQSYLGYLCLALALTHLLIYGVPWWITITRVFVLVRSFTFISSLLPILVLLLKFILLVPCLYVPLQRIRKGCEMKVPWRKVDTIGENDVSLTAIAPV